MCTQVWARPHLLWRDPWWMSWVWGAGGPHFSLSVHTLLRLPSAQHCTTKASHGTQSPGGRWPGGQSEGVPHTLDGSWQGRAWHPLTTQQPLLSNQHAGEGKGLLVVALEPLIHYLREAKDNGQPGQRPALSSQVGGVGVGVGPMAQFAISQTTVVQVAMTSGDAAQPLSGIQHSLCRPRSSPLPLPKGPAVCPWHLNRLPALRHGHTVAWSLCLKLPLRSLKAAFSVLFTSPSLACSPAPAAQLPCSAGRFVHRQEAPHPTHGLCVRGRSSLITALRVTT